MRIILVRHYKTTSNEDGKIIGWGDAPPAKNWREDTYFIAQVLLEAKLNASIIYTSSLSRTKNKRYWARLHHENPDWTLFPDHRYCEFCW